MSELKSDKMNWFWPNIVDVSSAKKSVNIGVTAALIVALMTLAVVITSMFLGSAVFGVDAWALVDVILFGIVAWRIKKYSKVFSVVGIILFVLEKVFQAIDSGPHAAGVISLIILLMFINGARGVFAYHHFSNIPEKKSVDSAASVGKNDR